MQTVMPDESSAESDFPKPREALRSVIPLLGLIGMLLAGITSGCAHQEGRPPLRPVRDALIRGPSFLEGNGYAYLWHFTIGKATELIWAPWVGYDLMKYGGAEFQLGLVNVTLDPREHRSAVSGPALGVWAAPPIDFGSYHAIVIGNNDYSHFPQLKTAVPDAYDVAFTLEGLYGFSVKTLPNATRSDIIGALAAARHELGAKDNLLLYYAGHGYLDRNVSEGYWLPIDAETASPANWISNSDIITLIRALNAKHVILVVDSCFAGSLTRDAGDLNSDVRHLARLARKKARVVLTSGGEEPVEDGAWFGGSGSVFTKYLLQALRGNPRVLEASALFSKIRRQVTRDAEQTPEYHIIQRAGHDGGDFLFVRRDGDGAVEPQ